MAERYGIDALRYFLLRDMHFGSDGSFSEESLVGRINADLANDLGNLFSRVLSMTARFCAGRAPAPGPDTEMEQVLKTLASDSLANFQNLFAQVRFSAALESLWELVRALNKYVDAAAPWALAKTGDNARLGAVLYTLLECMRKVALHLWPVMPGKAMHMLRQLGLEPDSGQGPEQGALPSEILQFGLLKPGTPVAAASNLFPRIEAEEAAQRKGKKDGNDKTPLARTSSNPGQPSVGASELPGRIDLSDFQKMDIRIGTVVECARHPQADILLRVMVDLGEETPRQILAGLAEFLSPEELPGRQVTVLVNLASRKMRGLESQGMILAVRTEKGMELLAPVGDVPPGSRVS
jgi:methionyl-tRNA synthetase